MPKIQIDEKTLRDAIDTIESLRKDLAAARGEDASLGSAIRKSLENPNIGGQTNTVGTVDMSAANKAMRAAILQPRDVAKAKKTAAAKKQANRDALAKSTGRTTDPNAAFYRSRGVKPPKETT